MIAGVELRIARPDDAPSIRTIYAPYVERSVISFETEPPDVATMLARMNKVLPQHPWLVATVAGEIAGYAYAGPHRERAAYRWSVDVTAYLDDRFHRRGIGRRLYDALCTLLQTQHIANAFGLVTLPNAASAALHESCGFVRCATETRVGYKFGAWHDVGVWQKQLSSDVATPIEPISFSDLPAAAVAEVLAR